MIPTFIFFLVLILLCILNFALPCTQLLLFLTFSFAAMTFAPPVLLGLLKTYSKDIYAHIIISSTLVTIIGIVAGSCLSRLRGLNKFFVFTLLLLCLAGSVMFRSELIYEKLFFNFYLFIIATLSILLGNIKNRHEINKYLSLCFLLTMLLTSLSANYLFREPSSQVNLIECFSKWCDPTSEYTMDNITMKGGYSYSLLKEMIGNKYELISTKQRQNLKKSLKNSKIGILITPTIPLTNQESLVVKEFVNNGGRLVVIADHTDLYGHGRVLNSLLNCMGIVIEYNALFSAGGNKNIYFRNMAINNLKTETPCSFYTTRPSYVFSWANYWLSEKANYTKPNFFGNLQWTIDDALGNWPVGGIVKYGKGEIVIWTDSTIFANFYIFKPNIIRFLGNLLKGGEFIARFSFYGLFLLIIYFCYSLLSKSQNSTFLFASGLLLFIISGMYFHWDCDPTNFYSDANRIDFYGKPKLLDEPHVNSLPEHGRFSSAYSHIARSGLRPLYIGEKPLSPVTNKSVWITNWQQATLMDDAILKSLWGIVILNLDDNITKIGFHKVRLEDDIIPVFNSFFYQDNYKRTKLETLDKLHTLSYKGTSIFAADGVLTDMFLGDWWITINISPYRKYILKEWFDWLLTRDDIPSFSYPSIGIEEGNNKWVIKFGGHEEIEKTLKITPYLKDTNYVYFGSGIWGLYEKNQNEEFILGGPELSDNLDKSHAMRWAAKYNPR